MPTHNELLRAEQRDVEGQIVGLKRQARAGELTDAQQDRLKNLKARATAIREQLKREMA